MTTYNTGNPVGAKGSADPRDLYDNAENLDVAVNTESEEEWTDRLGVERKTWYGIEQEAIAAIQNAGYVGTGTDNAVEDYAAGIEITQYNQIVRDTSGEFWRVSGSETLPYTLTGTGVPEGGALVSVGDAALRQDLVQPVATFNNVADMKAASGLDIGRKVRTLGYYAPGDGGGNDYEVVSSGTGSNYGFLFEQLTASGLEAKLLGGGIMEDKTAYIPSDYDTLQAAIDDLSKLRVTQGATIDLMIEAGHSLSQSLSINGGDYSSFIIKSQDIDVLVNTPDDLRFFRFTNCVAPTIDITLDGAGVLDECFRYVSARGTINSGKGGKNTTGRTLYASVSYIKAGGTVWKNGLEIFLTNGTSFSMGGVDVSGMSRAGVAVSEGSVGGVPSANIYDCSDMGLYLKDGCVVDAELITIDNCGRGVRLEQGVVELDRATITNIAGRAFDIVAGSMNAPDVTMSCSNSGGEAIIVQSGSHRITVDLTSLAEFSAVVINGGRVDLGITTQAFTAGVGSGLLVYGGECKILDTSVIKGHANDIRPFRGAIIRAFGVETSSSAVSGNFPDADDCDVANRGGFNAILGNARGIIWA